MKTHIKILMALALPLLAAVCIKGCYAIENNQYEKHMETVRNQPGFASHTSFDMEHKTLAQEGYEVHYFVGGNPRGETMVMLHPAFASHRCFDQQIEYFATDYRVITVDMLGHGLTGVGKAKDKITTTPKHINQLLQQEDVCQAHLVGVSLGSLLAQAFALQYPGQVLSLCGVGGYNINVEQEEVAKAQRGEMFKWLFKMIFSMDAFRQYVARTSAYDPVQQAYVYESTKYFTRKSFTVMQGLDTLIAHRPQVHYPYPMLIVVGEYDQPLALKMAAQWYSNIPGSRHVQIPAAGHCANMDNPAAFNAQLMEFISKTTQH